MLALEGAFEEKSFSNETVSFHKVVEILKLKKEPSIAKYVDGNTPVTFSFVPERMETDRDNPQRRKFAQSRELLSKVTLNVDGDQMSLTYFKNKTTNNGVSSFLPKRVQLFARSPYATFEANRKEEMLIALLSPECENSPFRIPEIAPIYRVHDVEVISRKEAAHSDDIFEFETALREMAKKDATTFVSMAKGVRIGAHTISADWTNLSDVQTKVIGAMRKDFDQFKTSWGDPATTWRGLIQDALDCRVLESHSRGNEIEITFNGTVWCKFSNATPIILGIMQYMKTDEHRIKLSLKNAVAEKTVASSTKNKK